jgi:zinc/manganese transport system permease protein
MHTLGFFQLLGAPLAAVLLFSGILAYLGVHIVRRQVIFVDLALGQVAALGALVAYDAGLEPGSIGSEIFMVGFALVAAAILAITRRRGGRIPQEAIVGVVFAVASALTYIVVDRSPHGAEHVTDVLTGAIVWTTWSEVGRAALVIGVAAAVLLSVHGKLVALAGEHATGSRREAALDFLFLACFGLVISTTVGIAGVLPTFAMLVAPSILGLLIAGGFGAQLAVAWGVSSLVGFGALVLSYRADVAAGPMLIAAQGAVLLAGGLALFVIRAKARARALGAVAIGAAASVLVVLAVIGGGHWLARSSWANPVVGDEAAAAPSEGGAR